MNVSIDHPTDRPNFSIVTVGNVRLAFSYQTVIGFSKDWDRWTLVQNYWGPTTGRHLNYLSESWQSKRLDIETFEARLNATLAKIGE